MCDVNRVPGVLGLRVQQVIIAHVRRVAQRRAYAVKAVGHVDVQRLAPLAVIHGGDDAVGEVRDADGAEKINAQGVQGFKERRSVGPRNSVKKLRTSGL